MERADLDDVIAYIRCLLYPELIPLIPFVPLVGVGLVGWLSG